MLHLGISGPDALIYWNNVPAAPDAAFEAALLEVNRVSGCAGKATAIDALVDWDAPWVLSGLEVGDVRVWRFTAQDEAVLLERDGGDLIARADGRTLVIPAAWTVASGEGFERGTWIVQAPGAARPREE
jgi:hypothetical protein